jgi:hypothetical protein
VLPVLVTVNRECRWSPIRDLESILFTAPKRKHAHLRFVREFLSADDVRREHPIFDRSFDIVAGPAELLAASDKLVAPYSVATDSTHHVFVADTEGGRRGCASLIEQGLE